MKGIFEKKQHFDIIAFKTDEFRGFPPRFHPHCELIYVNDGTLKVTVDGIEKTVCENGMAVVFPYVTHSYEKSESATVTALLFDPSETLYEKEFGTKKPKSPFCSDLKDICILLDRLCEFRKEGGERKRKAAIAYLNAALSEVFLRYELISANNAEPDNSKKILEYCSEHFTEPISIKSVSKDLFISESYVSKIFSEKLNYGFREYINMLRIDKAKRLLVTTNLKIVDVMLECGFKNQSSFNRVFRDIVEESPLEYRKTKS